MRFIIETDRATGKAEADEEYAEAMSHFSWVSGVDTTTCTSRCPVCLRVAYHQSRPELTDETVCCSDAHYEVYQDALMQLYAESKAYAAPAGLTIAEHIEHFLRHQAVCKHAAHWVVRGA